MTMGRGYKASLLQDFEAEYNTLNTTPGGRILPVNSIGLQASRAKNSAGTLTGRRDPVEPFDGNTTVSGDIVVPVDATAFGWWLKALMGAPTTTGASAPYTHVYKVGDTVPSMVLQTSYGTSPETYGKFSGCKVGSMSISFGGDGELTASFNVEGSAAVYSATHYNDDATLVTMQRLGNFQASIKEGGAAIATVTGLDLEINNGLDTEQYCIGGQGTRAALPEGLVSCSGTLTALFEDLTLLTKAQNSTETSLELTLSIDTNTSLSFKLPEVQYQFQGPTIEGPNGVRVELPFVAYYSDAADNSVLVATLKNSIASYAA